MPEPPHGAHRTEIYRMAVLTRALLLDYQTGMQHSERELIGRWIDDGTMGQRPTGCLRQRYSVSPRSASQLRTP
jgi:hypothetical protein